MAIANGTTLTLGDGTDKPIGVRFMTHAAALGVLLDPEFRLGKSYMNGTFVVEEGSVADVVEFGMAPTRRRIGCGRKRWRDIFGRDCRNLPARRGFKRRSRDITTNLKRHYIRFSSTPTGNTAVPISRRRTTSRRGPVCQEATPRSQAADKARKPRV